MNKDETLDELVERWRVARREWALEGSEHPISEAEAAFWLACDELDAALTPSAPDVPVGKERT